MVKAWLKGGLIGGILGILGILGLIAYNLIEWIPKYGLNRTVEKTLTSLQNEFIILFLIFISSMIFFGLIGLLIKFLKDKEYSKNAILGLTISIILLCLLIITIYRYETYKVYLGIILTILSLILNILGIIICNKNKRLKGKRSAIIGLIISVILFFLFVALLILPSFVPL